MILVKDPTKVVVLKTEHQVQWQGQSQCMLKRKKLCISPKLFNTLTKDIKKQQTNEQRIINSVRNHICFDFVFLIAWLLF